MKPSTAFSLLFCERSCFDFSRVHEHVLIKPLDSVLVRVQAQERSVRVGGSVSAAIEGLASSGGTRAFWRGAGPMLCSVPAQNALLFAGYGAGLGWCSISREEQDASPNPSLWHVFVGGCAGGFAQVREPYPKLHM